MTGPPGHPRPLWATLLDSMRASRRRAFTWIALAVLVCVSAALVEESFVHTDDGCSVEIHCLACRLAVGTAAVTSAAVAIHVDVEATALLAPETVSTPRQAVPRETPSRAPPLA
jgi:hypothetical protein